MVKRNGAANKGGRTALARRIPTKKKEEKNIEHPEGAMVYVSMINFAGCIEGATVNTGASDLKSRKTNGSEPSLVGGVGVPALGTLTITGSNMHRGIEMPVAQPYFSSRSRMGKRESDAHVRGAAVAQRLHSATFGGGETRHENAEASKIGGVDEVAPPRFQSLL